MPGTRSGHAFARIDQKQCAVGGALDQAGAVVEKLVRQPFQGNAAVRAAVAVGKYLAVLAYGKQFFACNHKAPALTFGQLMRGA
ncbi:hypothetical protein D9M68_940630 [compost metagenome]